MLSPMPGKIITVLVKSGDVVKKGDTLLIMEAMKMEHAIKASKDGKVIKVFFEEGEQIEGGIELVEMEN
ncbi:MAG: acetyl-CoA carboxylase biotin carboxyl carrier protein subunit [Epsilonproteobacteria bacterium]|nr:MAG: acetyl-CoA carboxylase biotin carboxyl carrier protein subunit [Campylobacterota bacterium]RLA64622.1 MAG: acetyl-CoA carboxylase biotin carboxyl carrier protein subunit [Campylobacterota bacterium]